MLIRRKFILILAGVNAILLALLLGMNAFSKNNASLPFYGAVGNFSLTASTGEQVTEKDLKGRPWLASFMFTRCAAACPSMNLKLKGLRHRLPDRLRFVSFTADPRRDDANTLSAYARKMGLEGGSDWLFLTGEKGALNRVRSEMRLDVADDPNLHSLRLILIDSNFRIRGYYDSGDEASLEKLASEAALLK